MDVNKKWLINVDGKVIGPCTTLEIAHGIISGQYDLSKEAILPFGGWKVVQDHQEILNVLDENGFNYSGQIEGTSSTGFLTESTVLRESVTESLTDPIDETVAQGAKDLPPVPSPPKAYQWAGNPSATRTHRRSGLLLWFLAITLGAGGWWVVSEYKRTGVSPLTAESGYADLVSQADKHKHFGKFQEALDLYRKALELKPRSEEVQRKIVPLLLRTEHQSVSAQRMIDELKMALTRPEDLKEVYVLKGLADLYGNRWVDAREAFDQSLELDSFYAPARFNRAMTYFMEGLYGAAAVDFSQLQRAFPEEATLLHIMSLIRSDAPIKDSALKELIDPLTESHFAYQQETLFVAMWSALQMEDHALAAKYANSFLTVDTDLSEQHFRDPLFFVGPLEWTSLLNLCTSLEGQLEPLWKAEAVLGLCYLKAMDHVQASMYLEKSFAREPTTITQALLSKMLFSQGDFERSKALLGQAHPPSSLIELLEIKMKALEGDYSEVEQQLASLENETYFALQAEYYRSWISFQRKNMEKARFHFRKLENLSPLYLPARELRDKIYDE